MKPNFNTIKDNLIAKLKSFQSNSSIYLVRNVYSRYAIYILGNDSYTKENFGQEHAQWIDAIEKISEQDQFILEDLKKTSTLITPTLFFSDRHLENTNWYIQDVKRFNAPLISFYAFKGGLGRTTTTVLTALLVARAGKKVMIFDFDLEAPGLASLFAIKEEGTEDYLGVKGFVDFLIDYEACKRNMTEIRFDDYYFSITDPKLVGKAGGELVIIPAIATVEAEADAYIDKLSKTNIIFKNQTTFLPDVFIQKMSDEIKPDYIFIDSRTGINDVGGLIFNRYAEVLFLLFYGNKQNMFGLASILPKLQNIENNKSAQFYLVNTPVPENPTDARAEKEYYIEKSYDIFTKSYYQENEIPNMDDESASHYPIHIPYNQQAVWLNSYQRFADLLKESDNPYTKLSKIILTNRRETGKSPQTRQDSTHKKQIIDAILQISADSTASAEDEFKSEADLTKYFYPRLDYKYIFDKGKFLILGQKGVGKTALFSVLSHRNYAKALADYCGVDKPEFDKTWWIIGLGDTPEFPNKENFESLTGLKASALRNYWMVWMIRRMPSEFIASQLPLILEIKEAEIRTLKNIAQQDIGETLSSILLQTDAALKRKNKTLIFVYDYLDRLITPEGGIRGHLVSALLSLFYDNSPPPQFIKAKIFLRKDIFDREVQGITDKVKILNYAASIQWEYNDLLNIVWKRIYEQNQKLSIFDGFSFEKISILGYIPKLSSESQHKPILDKLFGERMGGNNKAFPYNWVRLHVEDTNNQIHPRTLIKLFTESAKAQKVDNNPPLEDRVIRSKNIEKAVESVSSHQIAELEEEYPELRRVFTDLASGIKGSRSPMTETNLIDALKELNYDSPVDIIDKLKNIGVLKDYKSANINEKRYHVPDLYLHGMKLTRNGVK